MHATPQAFCSYASLALEGFDDRAVLAAARALRARSAVLLRTAAPPADVPVAFRSTPGGSGRIGFELIFL